MFPVQLYHVELHFTQMIHSFLLQILSAVSSLSIVSECLNKQTQRVILQDEK